MKRFIKIFFTVLFFITSLCVSFADDIAADVVFLQPENTLNLDISESTNAVYAAANQNYQIIYGKKNENSNDLCPDANMFESTAEQAFYRFVNNRIVNNRFSLFSMYIGEGNKARAP